MTGTYEIKSDGQQDLTQKAKSAAGTATQEVKKRAHNAADNAATEAADYADQAKGAAAGEVKDVASALRTAAHEMRSGSPQERTFSQIADSLADASDSIRDKDLGEMVGSVSDFAKRNPLVFLGSAALIGFAATRFAKASGDRSRRSNGYGNHGQDIGRIDTADLPKYSNSENTATNATDSISGGDKL